MINNCIASFTKINYKYTIILKEINNTIPVMHFQMTRQEIYNDFIWFLKKIFYKHFWFTSSYDLSSIFYKIKFDFKGLIIIKLKLYTLRYIWWTFVKTWFKILWFWSTKQKFHYPLLLKWRQNKTLKSQERQTHSFVLFVVVKKTQKHKNK